MGISVGADPAVMRSVPLLTGSTSFAMAVPAIIGLVSASRHLLLLGPRYLLCGRTIVCYASDQAPDPQCGCCYRHLRGSPTAGGTLLERDKFPTVRAIPTKNPRKQRPQVRQGGRQDHRQGTPRATHQRRPDRRDECCDGSRHPPAGTHCLRCAATSKVAVTATWATDHRGPLSSRMHSAPTDAAPRTLHSKPRGRANFNVSLMAARR